MNKEELIKIFSAYLPYNLEFRSATGKTAYISLNGCYKSEKSTFGNGVIEKSISLNSLLRDFKPVLYDLSYLTKEIGHEGKKVMPYKLLFDHDLPWDSKEAILEEALSFINNDKRLEYSYPYEFWQKLLSMHFNIFGLKENEFITKQL